MKRYLRGFRGIVIGLAMAIITLMLTVSPAFAQTTADVTVSAQGKFISFTSNVSNYDFGFVAESSTTNTSGTWIGFTNTSSITTNTSVKMLANAWTSAGVGWTHSDTAAGANTAAMKANSSNLSTWDSSVFVKFTAPFNEIQSSVVASKNFNTGLSLLAPVTLTDGVANNNTVRFTIYASS